MRLTNKDLRTMCAYYDRYLFGNKLPGGHVRFKDLKHCAYEGITYTHKDGTVLIYIDSNLRTRVRMVELILIHELIHAKGIHKHGKAFDREWQRLLKHRMVRNLL